MAQRVGGGGELERPDEPGVRIRDEKLKLGLVWSYDECSLICEDPSDYKKALTQTVSLLDNINEVAPIGKLKSRRLRVYWIKPVKNYDFKVLERKYRNRFIKENKIFEGCFDSSVIMEVKIGDYKLHHQSGAMDINQLQQQFRVFKMKQMESKLLIFLSTTVSRTDMVEYSNKNIRI